MTFYTLRLEQDELTRVIVENSHKEQVISDNNDIKSYLNRK